MRSATACLVAALLLPITLATRPAAAQFEPDPDGLKFDKPVVQRWKCGVIVRATGGPVRNVYCTVPIPSDWPEQEVKIIEEDISDNVRSVRYRVLDGGVKQMLVTIPQLAGGDGAKALVTVEVTRRAIIAPPDPATLRLAEDLDGDIRKYLGDSPYIEVRNAKIQDLSKEIVAGKEGAWAQTEAIYDWVRANVEYKNGEIKSALTALKDGYGDCEELTSLFISLCRANGVPARMVWVPDHCYPEFYLTDAAGKGHWIPCQAAGGRDFGSMPDVRPILQKGDNFRVPEKRVPQRYVAEFLKGVPLPGSGQPQVQFLRQAVAVP